MTDNTVFKLNKPDPDDPLQEILLEGARKMLAAAIEAEVCTFIERACHIQPASAPRAILNIS